MNTLLAFLALFGVASGFSCWNCASPELKSNWQLTGFPKMLDDSLFMESCHRLTDTWAHTGTPAWDGTIPTGGQATCDDMCIEMYLEIPTVTTETGAKKPLMVRGCHKTLMGYSITAPAKDLKVGGTIVRQDAQGNYKVADCPLCSTTARLMTCAADLTGPKPCNGHTDGTDNNLDVASTTNTCKQCFGNCKDATETCSGAWCTKQAGWLGWKWVESKGCAPFNAITINPVCVDQKVDHVFPSFLRAPSRTKRETLKFDGKTCLCNSDKCNNGASGIGLSLLLVAAAAVLKTIC